MTEMTFQLACDNELTFTNHENRLLFLHTDSMSAQLVLNDIGVVIHKHPNNIKVGFLSGRSEAYHSFCFKLDQFNRLFKFFKLLGFPLHGEEFEGNS